MWIQIDQHLINSNKLQGFVYNPDLKNILVILSDTILFIKNNIDLNDTLTYCEFINDMYDLNLHFFEYGSINIDNISNLLINDNNVYIVHNIDKYILLGTINKLPKDVILQSSMEI